MMEWQLNPIDMVRLRGRPCGEAPVATLEVKRQAEGVAERFGGEHLVDRARGAHPSVADQQHVGEARGDLLGVMGDQHLRRTGRIGTKCVEPSQQVFATAQVEAG